LPSRIIRSIIFDFQDMGDAIRHDAIHMTERGKYS
jgi:hypothetical protein